MSSTLTPFLYQTRTLQRAWRTSKIASVIASRTYASPPSRRRITNRRDDSAIPFDWRGDKPPEGIYRTKRQGSIDETQADESTITPSEATIFKSIFEEIAQGKMPPPKIKPRQRTDESTDDMMESTTTSSDSNPRSIVELARMTEFRERTLANFPESLREAAHLALGLFELKSDAEVIGVDQESEKQRAERMKYERVRAEEKARVHALMKACETDVALWEVMEKEVFSLPVRLGIAKAPKTTSSWKGKEAASASYIASGSGEDQRQIMDVHGPLYSHFLSQGLFLFDTAFARPSPLAFQILPRVRAFGLPSYVLGVSTTFYTTLAAMHWDRFGDASTALDMLQEMMSTGLFADDEVRALLQRFRDQLFGCTYGVQGSFVGAIMDVPPFDGALMQRIDELEELAKISQRQAEGDYSS